MSTTSDTDTSRHNSVNSETRVLAVVLTEVETNSLQEGVTNKAMSLSPTENSLVNGSIKNNEKLDSNVADSEKENDTVPAGPDGKILVHDGKISKVDAADGRLGGTVVTLKDIKKWDGHDEITELPTHMEEGKDRDSVDRMSVFSLFMEKNARYYFQHPYARIFVAYLVVFCNFLITAEDPVAHSRKECTIPVIGNSFAFVVTYYPSSGFSVLKVVLWLTAIVCGIFFGKFIIHKILLNRCFKLKMFSNDQGSFMTMFLSTILTLFVFSWVYNLCLLAGGDNLRPYRLSSLMGVKNSFFMKAAACGTWLGDFFTAWMVTDIMLQEKLYPNWAKPVRAWWRRGYNRIILFWVTMVILTILVIVVITTDIINWDKLNRDFLPTNEVSRAFLASFILIMDLLIVMQDWDFPHFINSFDIKLPGLNTAHIKFEIPRCLDRFKENWTVHITGKWFNYGIIMLVMILDLNMWKNQIFYAPYDYGQYIGPDNKVYTVRNQNQLASFNETMLSYAYRSTHVNDVTNRTYINEDESMNSRYLGISFAIKGVAFIPVLIGFIVFGSLIYAYGRYKPCEIKAYGGRLMKRRKSAKLRISPAKTEKKVKKAKLRTSKRSRSIRPGSSLPINYYDSNL